MKGLQHYISEITNTVTSISEKNLNFSIDGEYAGDYEKIETALISIVKDFEFFEKRIKVDIEFQKIG